MSPDGMATIKIRYGPLRPHNKRDSVVANQMHLQSVCTEDGGRSADQQHGPVANLAAFTLLPSAHSPGNCQAARQSLNHAAL